MNEITLKDNQIASDNIKAIVQVIADGGLVVLPSDTVLGVVASISKASLEKINRLKSRASGKSYAVIFDSVEAMEQAMAITPAQRVFIEEHAPGLFTFVFKPQTLFDPSLKLILSSEGKIGIRIPASELMRAIGKLSGPYLATSVNISGQPAVYSLDELKQQLGEKMNQIELIVNGELSSRNDSSTVVDISGSEPVILRQGSGQL